ncbi:MULTISPECIES: ATP-binding protein [Scytonema]
MNSSFCIEDTGGKLIFGTDDKESVQKHPVKLLDEIVGWVIGSKKAETVAFLLSYLVQQQYEKKLLAHELLDKYQEIDLFHDIFTQISASLNPKEVAQLVLEEARKLIQFTTSAILLLNNNTNRLDILWEDVQNVCFENPLIKAQEIIDTIIKSGQGEIVNDVFSDPRFVDRQVNFHSFMCVPLITEKQVIGAIVLLSETPTTYSTQDLKLLTILALQTAVAIEKAVLYEQNCNALHVAQEQTQQLQRTLYELQQTQSQLIQSEKMSSLGQLVAGVAHEINNPVNYVVGNLKYAQKYTQDLLKVLHLYQQNYPQPVSEIKDFIQDLDLEFLKQDFTNLLSSMHLGIERIRQLALSLRNFSRLEREEMKPVDLHEGIDNTLLILQSRLKPNERHRGIEIIKKFGNLPLVDGYANQLNQVFMNLIANAIDAIEGQEKPGIINIYTELIAKNNFQQFIQENFQLKDLIKNYNSESELPICPSVVVVISDNGMGMDETVRSHLFEPFFTTKATSKGTGLGLSISHQIIEKHGGRLQCVSQAGKGTAFWIEIPIQQTTLKSLETSMTVLQKTY